MLGDLGHLEPVGSDNAAGVKEKKMDSRWRRAATIRGLTCLPTTPSPPPPSSPSLQSRPLSPAQSLARERLWGGCRRTLSPAPLSSAPQPRLRRRAGGGAAGASGSPEGV